MKFKVKKVEDSFDEMPDKLYVQIRIQNPFED